MGDKSKIEWLDGGASWNPVTGCTPISEGCLNCYAKTMAETRLRGMFGYDKEDPFKVTYHEDKLDQPLKWKKPRRIFVCSMGDLFHEDVPDEKIDQIMSIILASYIFTNTKKHTFILLTKRAERMRHYFSHREPMEMFKTWINICPIFSGDVSITFSELVKDAVHGSWYKTDSKYKNKLWPMPNLWIGVTAENQRTADERIPILLSTPAAKRFVSVEPMLEAINHLPFIGCPECGQSKNMWFPNYTICRNCGAQVKSPPQLLDWVICGAETGPNARPMNLDWARGLRDQCAERNVSFFFKKAGPNNTPIPDDLMIREYPKEGSE